MQRDRQLAAARLEGPPPKRLRLQHAVPLSQLVAERNYNDPVIWLDVLPREVSAKVFNMLRNCSNGWDPTYNLSVSSQQQRQAFIHSCNRTFKSLFASSCRWYDIIYDHDFYRLRILPQLWQDDDDDTIRKVVTLLSRHSLTSLAIKNQHPYLQAAALLPHLSTLELCTTANIPTHIFISTLEKVSLTNLSLTCTRYCTFAHMLPEKSNWHEVAAATPKLKHLALFCCGRANILKYPHLNRFACLTCFATNSMVPNREIPYLQTLPEVKLYCRPANLYSQHFIPFQLAKKIGQPVTFINNELGFHKEAPDDTLTLEDAHSLHLHCPNLRALHTKVSAMAELRLVAFVMEDISTLVLQFVGEPQQPSYFPVRPFIFALMCFAPRLRVVKLHRMHFCTEHLIVFLQRGTGLEVLEVMMHYHESPLQRLLSVLLTLAEFNSRLRLLSFSGHGLENKYVHVLGLSTVLWEIKQAASLLRRRATSLKWMSLLQCITDLAEWAINTPIYSFITPQDRDFVANLRSQCS